MNSHKSRNGLIVSMLLLLSVSFAWYQRQYIYDWSRLRNYSVSIGMSELATATTMNAKARNIFYVQHPELDNKVVFDGKCDVGEQTIVLGCYISKKGIFVYDVTDARLAGVKEVTSAHEMLHVAYDRLSQKDRIAVDSMVENAYSKLNDTRIKDTVEQYKKNKADVKDELHSILGTEVRTLPADLESYYKKYFDNRLVVVSFSEKYESVFTDRKNKVEQFDQQLNSLKVRIDSSQADLASQIITVDQKREQLDAELAASRYDLYNAGVAPFNSLVKSYNNKIASTRGLIDQYNQTLDQRNAIALEEQELYKAIDSRLTTQTAK